MLQKVGYVLDMNKFEEEVNELKFTVMGDNGMKHNVVEEGSYTVIYMKNNDKVTDEKYMFYGRVINDRLYIARMQYIAPIEFDEPDFYNEFFSNSVELN